MLFIHLHHLKTVDNEVPHTATLPTHLSVMSQLAVALASFSTKISPADQRKKMWAFHLGSQPRPTTTAGQSAIFTQTRVCHAKSRNAAVASQQPHPSSLSGRNLVSKSLLTSRGQTMAEKLHWIKEGVGVWPWPEPVVALSCWPLWSNGGQSNTGPTASSTPFLWLPLSEATMTKNRQTTLNRQIYNLQMGVARTITISSRPCLLAIAIPITLCTLE